MRAKFLFVNTAKMYQFKANNSEIKKTLSYISKVYTPNNIKK